MKKQLEIVILTMVLWFITLVMLPFFYSGDLYSYILQQPDLILVSGVSFILLIGSWLQAKVVNALIFLWSASSIAWITLVNVLGLFKEHHLQLIGSSYPRPFFNIDELWIIVILCLSYIITIYFLIQRHKHDVLKDSSLQSPNP